MSISYQYFQRFRKKTFVIGQLQISFVKIILSHAVAISLDRKLNFLSFLTLWMSFLCLIFICSVAGFSSWQFLAACCLNIWLCPFVSSCVCPKNLCVCSLGYIVGVCVYSLGYIVGVFPPVCSSMEDNLGEKMTFDGRRP